MSDSLKNTLSFIVYLPLIIVCLSVLGSIGYGIYTYRTTGNFPPSWVTAGRIFLYILKQILYTLKLLVINASHFGLSCISVDWSMIFTTELCICHAVRSLNFSRSRFSNFSPNHMLKAWGILA